MKVTIPAGGQSVGIVGASRAYCVLFDCTYLISRVSPRKRNLMGGDKEKVRTRQRNCVP